MDDTVRRIKIQESKVKVLIKTISQLMSTKQRNDVKCYKFLHLIHTLHQF